MSWPGFLPVIESYVPDLKIDLCGHKEETTLFSLGAQLGPFVIVLACCAACGVS